MLSRVCLQVCLGQQHIGIVYRKDFLFHKRLKTFFITASLNSSHFFMCVWGNIMGVNFNAINPAQAIFEYIHEGFEFWAYAGIIHTFEDVL